MIPQAGSIQVQGRLAVQRRLGEATATVVASLGKIRESQG